MSWYSPRMPTGGTGPYTSGSSPSSSITTRLNKEPPPPPQTPDQVKNLGLGVCYDLGAFRELMRQYRLLDDGVTTRLNRTIARSRSSGQTHSPSLLYSPESSSSSSSSSPTSSDRFSSSSAADLGTTTYIASDEACGAFWRELTGYWKGRQDVIRYCIEIVDKGALPNAGNGVAVGRGSGSSSDRVPGRRDDRDLDADFPSASGVNAKTTAARPLDTNSSSSAFPGWDDRGSRAEHSDQALRRQLHNELTIDEIIRNRSLQAFKSRCTLFRLPQGADEEEQKFWQGQR